jgi:uncharacterized membrane protein
MAQSAAHRSGDRLATAALVVLYAFTVVALVGYTTFGLNPGLLARYPQVAGFYGISFRFFAQAQIWIAWAALAFLLWRHSGFRWIPAFVALYLISLGAELMGTTVGLPFGEYHYTEALGRRWFGHVPLLIPLSWFFMAIPSYAIARRVLPDRPVARVTAASLILLAWDLSLDPAMSRATAYWVWAEPGAYYGMPWLNLFGWYVTGLALMAALAALRSDGWIASLPLRWLMLFYGANLLLPVGMSAAAGLWGAVAATIVALGAAALLGRMVAPRRSAGARLSEVGA